MNPKNEQYGEKRLNDYLMSAAKTTSADDVIKGLSDSSIEQFVDRCRAIDDITMLAL
jgi:serine phosphatase RsbU (regulator of sigma subunit)